MFHLEWSSAVERALSVDPDFGPCDGLAIAALPVPEYLELSPLREQLESISGADAGDAVAGLNCY